MSDRPVILWFRNDLRLANHRALTAAVETGAPVICLYILDDESPGLWSRGAASRWWLAHSLAALAGDLESRGARLILRRGVAAEIVAAVTTESKASALYFTRSYEPWAAAQEHDIKQALDRCGVSVKRFGGQLLREPEDVRTKLGEVYKVYTPFWRALSHEFSPPKLLAAPAKISPPKKQPASDRLKDWGLHPTKPDWSGGLADEWTPGEAGGKKRLAVFLKDGLKTYAADRNRPDRPGTSRLSPHLHFGEMTPAACWHGAVKAAAEQPGTDTGLETFLKEIVWREFATTLLFYWPDLPDAPFRKDFAAFPWREDAKHLKAWQRGQTGYPIVDAGMRELWSTGYMHNRVRMIVASFLIKHLLIPWQQGEAWFWDTLVDADLANNAASWQWVAGSGADAAPYFRIFNPVTQGEKFDPDGLYVKRWVPELGRVPAGHVHAPWLAPPLELASAGVTLGKTYPQPIVDHAAARARALAAYETVKAAAKK